MIFKISRSQPQNLEADFHSTSTTLKGLSENSKKISWVNPVFPKDTKNSIGFCVQFFLGQDVLVGDSVQSPQFFWLTTSLAWSLTCVAMIIAEVSEHKIGIKSSVGRLARHRPCSDRCARQRGARQLRAAALFVAWLGGRHCCFCYYV